MLYFRLRQWFKVCPNSTFVQNVLYKAHSLQLLVTRFSFVDQARNTSSSLNKLVRTLVLTRKFLIGFYSKECSENKLINKCGSEVIIYVHNFQSKWFCVVRDNIHSAWLFFNTSKSIFRRLFIVIIFGRESSLEKLWWRKLLATNNIVPKKDDQILWIFAEFLLDLYFAIMTSFFVWNLMNLFFR